MIREHEKFWAFIALLVAIVVISLPSLIGDVGDVKLTLADKVIVGLIGVLGTVAGALFSRSADKLADTVQQMAHSQSSPPVQKVDVVNPPERPANVSEAEPAVDLPEYAR